MKELDAQKKRGERTQIESIIKKKKAVELMFEDSIKPVKGHRLFEVDVETLEVYEAEFVSKKTISWFDAVRISEGTLIDEVLIKPNKVYVSALNGKNAVKRYQESKGSKVMPKGGLKLTKYI